MAMLQVLVPSKIHADDVAEGSRIKTPFKSTPEIISNPPPPVQKSSWSPRLPTLHKRPSTGDWHGKDEVGDKKGLAIECF